MIPAQTPSPPAKDPVDPQPMDDPQDPPQIPEHDPPPGSERDPVVFDENETAR